jgi:hypothetical protein
MTSTPLCGISPRLNPPPPLRLRRMMERALRFYGSSLEDSEPYCSATSTVVGSSRAAKTGSAGTPQCKDPSSHRRPPGRPARRIRSGGRTTSLSPHAGATAGSRSAGRLRVPAGARATDQRGTAARGRCLELHWFPGPIRAPRARAGAFAQGRTRRRARGLPPTRLDAVRSTRGCRSQPRPRPARARRRLRPFLVRLLYQRPSVSDSSVDHKHRSRHKLGQRADPVPSGRRRRPRVELDSVAAACPRYDAPGVERGVQAARRGRGRARARPRSHDVTGLASAERSCSCP